MITVAIFQCLDFDEDDMISEEDVKEVVNRLTGDQRLSDDQLNQLVKNVGIYKMKFVLNVFNCFVSSAVCLSLSDHSQASFPKPM